MCLLERVVDCNDASIRCSARIAIDSPLKLAGRLPATALIEYAAQAMAAHGVLLGRQTAPLSKPRQGVLVGLRGVDLAQRWVEPSACPFDIVATRHAGDDRQVIYHFEVRDCNGAKLASGRATVLIDAA